MLDKILNEHYQSTIDNQHIIFYVGDHGMENVSKTIDIISLIEVLPKNLKKQIKCFFIDSTLCRIWLKDKSNKKEVIFALNNLNKELSNKGDFLDVSLFPGYSNRENGDILWAANPDVIIWPDYFHMPHLSIPKGMHGYISPNFKESISKGVVIATPNFDNLDQSMPTNLVDVGKKIISLLAI